MLNINPWNMVMIVINLLVLYAIFRKFLYKPAKLALIAARKIIETGEAHDAEGSK